MITHYHAGYNMPGYLPEMDVATFTTFADAKRYMVDEMDRIGDHEYDGTDDHECQTDGGECPVFGDHCGWTIADSLSAEMEDLNLVSGPEWGTIVGNLSYWIIQCDEAGCELYAEYEADET